MRAVGIPRMVLRSFTMKEICPDCKATGGHKCRSRTGRECAYFHQARTTLALPKAKAELERMVVAI